MEGDGSKDTPTLGDLASVQYWKSPEYPVARFINASQDCVDGLSPAQAQEMREAFSLFDKNGDEKISKEELGPVLRALGRNPTQADLDHMMAEADVDNSGYLSYKEYTEVIKNHMTPLDDVKIGLRQAFLTFDHDKNGYLNLLELQKVLCSIGEALSTREAAIVLKAVDTNNDGKVDVEEFVNFLCDKV